MKAIVLETCARCPHLSHTGAFAEEPFVPRCVLAKRLLPYIPAATRKRPPVTDYAIPEWCPLPDFPEVKK